VIWLALSAHAAAPVVLSVTPVTLAQPEPPAMIPARPTWTEGTLLALRVDPETRIPSQGPMRHWWVGDQPVRGWGFDPVGGCAVFLVEGPVDLLAAPVFLGPAELPERLDGSTTAARLRDAVSAGALPLPRAEIVAHTRPALALPHAGALNPLAEALMAECTGGAPPPPTVPLR
jgi:hypothetical protein